MLSKVRPNTDKDALTIQKQCNVSLNTNARWGQSQENGIPLYAVYFVSDGRSKVAYWFHLRCLSIHEMGPRLKDVEADVLVCNK